MARRVTGRSPGPDCQRLAISWCGETSGEKCMNNQPGLGGIRSDTVADRARVHRSRSAAIASPEELRRLFGASRLRLHRASIARHSGDAAMTSLVQGGGAQ